MVRHGETDVNLNNQNNDAELNTPINATGQTQAYKTADYFNKMKNLTHNKYIIFSSPSLRAKQTAAVIANKLDTEIIYDDRLVETDKGDANGLTDKDP